MTANYITKPIPSAMGKGWGDCRDKIVNRPAPSPSPPRSPQLTSRKLGFVRM